jgi:hypothetical protein
MELADYQHAVGALSTEFAETGLDVNQLFMWSIHRMNSMYDLPINTEPTLDGLGESPLKRMAGFMKTLQKEMEEGQEIMAVLEMRDILTPANDLDILAFLEARGISGTRAVTLASLVLNAVRNHDLDRQILVMLADWLADMTVYQRSEALKFGIPLESVLACVMGSNFTKLGEDGMPIKDANGKVQKGPNFVAPEAAIYATMFESHLLIAEANDLVEAATNVQALALPILHDPMADILFADEVGDASDEEYFAESDDVDHLVP